MSLKPINLDAIFVAVLAISKTLITLL